MDLKDKKLVYVGTFLDNGGYAYMNREYVKGLLNRNWNVRIEAIQGPIEIDKDELDFFNKLRLYDENKKPIPILEPDVVKIVAHLPLINIPQFKKNIIYTMMESQKVNSTFIHNCNKFYDVCWTPTKYNADVFKEAGMDLPIRVLPIGIDDMFCQKNVLDDFCLNFKVFGPNNPPDQPRGYKFLSVFRWSFRKGFDALFKSFLREFKAKDDVSLVIMSRHAAMSHQPEFNEAVERDIQALIGEHAGPDSPPIYWCNDIIPTDLMPSMYNIGDCFITCSRGEGLGIPLLEASKVGLPLISPNHTGMTDYLTDENSFNFDVDEWVVCNEEPGWSGWVTRDFWGQKFPKFGDEKISQIQAIMRWVKDHPEIAAKKNKNMRKTIDGKYNWGKCVDTVERYLNTIFEEQ